MPDMTKMPQAFADVEPWLDPHEPALGATPQAVQAWHELRATVYRHVSETDPRHHYEALANADIDKRKAAALAAGKPLAL